MPHVIRPVTMARASEELVAAHFQGDVMVPSNMKCVRTGLEGEVLLPKAFSVGRDNGWRKVPVIADGNRAVIIPGTSVALGEREFLVGVKGIGARNPMYGDGPHKMAGVPSRHEPTFSSEVWFGENPWGALSRKACMEDMAITEMAADGVSINGFHICPMVSASALPDRVMADARDRYWYRRFDGGQFYQEVRLVPSDVRLFSQSESTLGERTPGVLRAFGIDTPEDLDWFLENYIRSGMAALTLMARTVKEDGVGSGPVALDYDDVWLDKDSVIAPDGTMFFADLEGLEWVPLGCDPDIASRMMMKQFDRNFYEFMYGLDRLLDERDRLAGRTLATKPPVRRKEVAARVEIALARFPLLTVEPSENALHIIIKPNAGPVRELDVRMLDLGGNGR